MRSSNPGLSVLMMTYNHESYIGKAIESALMQKTNVDFEIVIGEDISNDNTREICTQYALKYESIIRLIPSKNNLGMVPNFLRCLAECKGEYIALLEGDDYWINPLKLQKQYDFLISHKGFSLCFHNAFVLTDNGYEKKVKLFNNDNQIEVTSFQDVIKNWYISTASIMFRRNDLQLPEWFHEIKNWDWAIQIFLSRKGNIKYMNEIYSVYYQHLGGNSFNPEYSTLETIERRIKLLEKTNQLYNNEYSKIINIELKKLKREKYILLQKFNFPKTWGTLKRIKSLFLIKK